MCRWLWKWPKSIMKKKMNLSLILLRVYLHYNNLKSSLQNSFVKIQLLERIGCCIVQQNSVHTSNAILLNISRRKICDLGHFHNHRHKSQNNGRMWKEFFIQIFNPNKIVLHKLGKWLIDGSVYFLLYSMSSVSFVKLPVNDKKIISLLNTNLSRNKNSRNFFPEQSKKERKNEKSSEEKETAERNEDTLNFSRIPSFAPLHATKDASKRAATP